jgi:xylan 1,4-beta-xylosidase
MPAQGWAMFKTLLLLLTALAARPSAAQEAKTFRNPIMEAGRPADPHVLRHEGKYYLYPTTDGRGFDVFISTDLIHWEKKPKCFTDPRGGAWAPDVYHHAAEGKFYLYYTLNEAPRSGGLRKIIGVAVADSPLGPFVDKGKLADRSIDAHLFRDDTDGSLWLYYVALEGGFKIMVQPMTDPLTKRGEAKEVLRPTAAWEKARGEVTEGPWMLKHGKRYYLMYSGSGADGPDYGIGYATSDSPAGPFVKYEGNPIVHRGGGIFGPGHHCVVTGPGGKLWMIYHQQRSEKPGWDRFLALDPISFDEKGILHATATRDKDQPAP